VVMWATRRLPTLQLIRSSKPTNIYPWTVRAPPIGPTGSYESSRFMRHSARSRMGIVFHRSLSRCSVATTPITDEAPTVHQHRRGRDFLQLYPSSPQPRCWAAQLRVPLMPSSEFESSVARSSSSLFATFGFQH
jgi:hypothetical protein